MYRGACQLIEQGSLLRTQSDGNPVVLPRCSAGVMVEAVPEVSEAVAVAYRLHQDSVLPV